MKVSSSTHDGVVVLHVKGRISGHDDADILDDKLYAAIGRGFNRAVVDLSGCDWISSAGIRTLIHHHNCFKRNYGELKLANLTRKIEKIVTITRLAQVFSIYESRDEAILSFSYA
jgi:anti-sigma B factor antagonist